MEIRKGRIEEVKIIMNIIKNSILQMESENIYQWDEIYPDEDTIVDDINSQTLYVYTDENTIKGFMVINRDQDEQYEALKWDYNLGRHLVIHRLCIDSRYQRKGIAKTLLEYADMFGKQNKYESIRLDAFIQNKRACNMYEKAGYRKVGIVTFRKGDFYCFEKGLCLK